MITAPKPKQMPMNGNIYYNTDFFPILVAHHGNWDIYRNEAGYCAAIPVVEGCKASHFGDMNYLKFVSDLEYVKCGFQAFGFMPPCVLDPDHEGDHEDGVGGFYGRAEGSKLVQVEGSKELRYAGQDGL